MANPETGTPSEAPTILVVEDNSHIAYMVRFVLEREGYRVAHAADGREAQNATAGAPPALVVLDVMLPFIDGFELLTLMRARADWAGVPIIMLTAKAQDADIVRALDAGANDYMIKPFRPEELLARVRRFIGKPG